MDSFLIKNKKLSGITVCVFIGILATYLAKLQNFVGAPIIGLFMGMALLNFIPSFGAKMQPGATWTGKKFLIFGIIMAGGTLNFIEIMGFGAKALPLIIINIVVAFSIAYFVGKRLALSRNTSTLVGGGTSICGGTAIATLAGIIKATEDEICYAITAVFLFDILATVSYPYIATSIGLTANQFGFLAGASINDTAGVVAAEATFNALNGLDIVSAITFKLTRTTMLIVLSIIFTILKVREDAKKCVGDEKVQSVSAVCIKVFPWFILYFLAAALFNTLGVFDLITNMLGGLISIENLLKQGYKILITIALAGIGFKVRYSDLCTQGAKPIILGGFTWAGVAISSFIFIFLFANYVG